MAAGNLTVQRGRRNGDMTISTARRAANAFWWGVCCVALALVIIPVAWILEGIISHAAQGWHFGVLDHITTGTGGGLENAITGTLVITLGVGIIASIIGIGCGVYLAELCRVKRLVGVLRTAFEVLAGIPSIVFGYVGYIALVVGLHWQFSLAAALIVMSILVVPYIAKATELALGQVPVTNREGGEALGMTRTYVLRRIVLRSALPGILTGIIVALAISVGETAPLLYTAGWANTNPSGALIHAPVGYLTYAAYKFYDDPSAVFQALASDAALILLVIVIALIASARLVVRLTQRYAPNRPSPRPTRAQRRMAANLQAGTTVATVVASAID
jgi:phosphate transport system permease protein